MSTRRVEAYVAAKLGLAVEPVSTQVMPRDRHAAFFATLGVIASGIERLATEVRHLQRSEVREAEEFFHAGQKGSSAMPHKRNPVLSENLCGLARLVRAAVIPAMENVALWHERDISHSSVERGIGPDATVTLDFALSRLAGMIDKLTIYPEQMLENLESLGGVVHSGEVLLALTKAGILREDAYKIVQRNAMATWTKLGKPGGQNFRANLLADPEVAGRVSAGRDRCGDGFQAASGAGGCDFRPRLQQLSRHHTVMCSIILRTGADGVLIGANRDEMVARPLGGAGGILAGDHRRPRPPGRRHLDGDQPPRCAGRRLEPARQPRSGAGKAQPGGIAAPGAA